MQELLKRSASHLERLGGAPVCDLPAAMAALQQSEDDALQGAVSQTPTEVALQWAWADKVFDAFLSHKITDAKDIVLTW